MDKKYFDSTHRFGRIGALIGIVFMLGIPAVISQVYGVWPESVGSVFMTGSALLAVFIPSNPHRQRHQPEAALRHERHDPGGCKPGHR